MAAAVAQRVDAERVGTHQLLKSWAQPPCIIRHNMSQLPLPPSIPGEQGIIESPNFAIQPDQSQPPASAEATNKKRKASRNKLPSDLKRSQSTPHMRGLAMADTSSISPTIDKRRNKLGYHRTSVACGKFHRPYKMPTLTLPRTLSKEKDSLSLADSRRSTRTMRQLYSLEKGMQFLSCQHRIHPTGSTSFQRVKKGDSIWCSINL
jgi:hypothetical protein